VSAPGVSVPSMVRLLADAASALAVRGPRAARLR
jgi:hypothetical protein